MVVNFFLQTIEINRTRGGYVRDLEQNVYD